MNKKIIKGMITILVIFLSTWNFSCSNSSDTPTPSSVQTTQETPDDIYYIITFASNNNTATGNTETVRAKANTRITLPTNGFSLDGYNFSGWNTEANGSGTGYSDGATIILTSNITLYAQWIPVQIPTFTITSLSVENGTVTFSQSIAEANTVIRIMLTPNTYYLINSVSVIAEDGTVIPTEADQNNSNIYSFIMPRQNVSVRVSFILESFTVTFITDCSISVSSQVVARNSKASNVVLSDNSECEGFLGWYTEAECLNQFDFDTSIESGITLYAKWRTFKVAKRGAKNRIESLMYSCSIKPNESFIGISAIDALGYTTREAENADSLIDAFANLYTNKPNIRISLDLSLWNQDTIIRHNSRSENNNVISVILPQSLEHIEFYLFANFKALEHVEIPQGVTVIGCSAFQGCTNLSSVTFLDAPQEWTFPGEGLYIYTFTTDAEENARQLKQRANAAYSWSKGRP